MTTNKLEDSLADLYKGAPHLPTNGRKVLVEWVPWINLVIGVLTLSSAWYIWHWAHSVNALINYANSFGAVYGVAPTEHRLTVGVWLGIIVLVVEAVLLLMSFSPAKAHQKKGWDLMYYVALLNIASGIILAFTNYGSVLGSLIGALIGSAIAFYFLFEIRSFYKDHATKNA